MDKVKLKLKITLITAIDIVLLCLNLLTGYYVQSEQRRGSANNLNVLPLLCDDLSLGPDDDIDTFENQNKKWKYSLNGEWKYSLNGEGKYICESKNVSSAIDQVVERQSRLRLALGLDKEQYLSCGNQSLAPNTGHLSAFFTRISSHHISENGEQAKINWDRHQHHSYIHPEMRYHDGEITIPEGRTYFVYGSVLFNLTMYAGQPGNLPHRLSIRICKIVYGYERTIFGKTELVKGNQTSGMRSLNINSFVMLRKDDVLLMRVSDLQGLHRESRGNTFGIFPV